MRKKTFQVIQYVNRLSPDLKAANRHQVSLFPLSLNFQCYVK